MTQPTEALVIAEPHQPSGTALALIRPIAKPTDLLKLHDEVAAIIQQALTKGVDFDVVPGTGDKPSLMKAGAEKLNLAFGAAPEFEVLEKEIDHHREVRWTKRKKEWFTNESTGKRDFKWVMEDGTSLGAYRYVVRCRIVREGRVLAACIGTCSTLESKYIDRPRDCENTVLKMAQKRAMVGATLHAYALSQRFTQDVEDNKDQAASAQASAAAAQATEADDRGMPYDGSTEHQTHLQSMIEGKVPEDLWEEVHNRMKGKYLDELRGVVKQLSDEVRAKRAAADSAPPDKKQALEEFEKAYAGIRQVGGDAEKILGKKINDVLLGDAAGILAAADTLSAWEPAKA